MKQLLALAAALAATPALAAEPTLIRFDDANTFFQAALGKQVDIRFSESLASGRLPQTDYDSVVLSQMPDGKACFFGQNVGINPEDPKLADVEKGIAGDICVARADVSVKAPPAEAADRPARPFYTIDKANCAWRWSAGNGIGVWNEDCRFETGHWEVTYDAAHDHFALSVDGGDPFPVLRQFRVAAGQGPADLLPDLKAKGLVLNDAECVFIPYTEQMSPMGWDIWRVMPTGERKRRFEGLSPGEVPEPPCGELGFAADNISFFMVRRDHPNRVLYVNLGQDGTMIDPFSVRLF